MSDPGEVCAFLDAFATRHGLALPTDQIALQFELEILASMTRGEFREAAKHLLTTWTYRRMPAVGDFTKAAGDHSRDLRYHRSALLELGLKLKTLSLQAGQWAEEAHEMDRAARQIRDNYLDKMASAGEAEKLGKEEEDDWPACT